MARTFASTSLRMQSTWRFPVSSPGAAQQRQLFLSLHGLCNGLLESILGVQGEDTVFELIGLLQWLVDVAGVGQSGKDKFVARTPAPRSSWCSLAVYSE